MFLKREGPEMDDFKRKKTFAAKENYQYLKKSF